METLYLVQKDTRPSVRLKLRDKKNGRDLDVSSPSTIVVLKMRAVGSLTTLETLLLAKPNGGDDGVVEIQWTGASLQQPGEFEAEITVSFNGAVQTVYEVIPIIIRPDFG